ncbi:MAG TPA: imidazole glycerol phosphate synthase subunit HisH [Candidatus Dormibacteraeota bacterium]|nr:imidazole glycerol phosphate synthase subunit HisH [Candidatus Dormibacteraeota bacterium]
MITIVDFGAGNMRSIENALERIGTPVRIAATPEAVASADALILPGVGAAAPAMARLRERKLAAQIVDAIANGVPFLGICLGMQLLFERSAEDGASCLGVFPGSVERMVTTEKLPHVGWNTIDVTRPHPVLSPLDGEAMYFVHSYAVVPANRDLIIAETSHGGPFVSAIAADQVVAVQFHPERSGQAGLRLLESFVRFAGVGAAHVA